MGEDEKICGGIVFCCCVILSIILISVLNGHLETITPLELGLKKSTYTETLLDDEKIWDPGYYRIGYYETFIRYPNSPQFQTITVTSRTKEGLVCSIQFGYEFNYNVNNLPAMYKIFEADHNAFLYRFAKHSLRYSTFEYSASDYWLKRKEVAEYFKTKLIEDLKEFVVVSDFMLLKSNFASAYESSLITTQVTDLQLKLYENLREVEKTKQETRNIQAYGASRIKILSAEASAKATKVYNEGMGTIAQQNIQYTTNALAAVQEKLQFKNKGKSLIEFYKYQKIMMLKSNTRNTIVIGNVPVGSFHAVGGK